MSGKDDYSDMIDLKRPVSARRQPMDRINRAAQFAPFASLTGYGEAINETGRRVDKKISLSPSEMEKINEKLRFLEEKGAGGTLTVVYFVPDKKKAGGSYRKFTGVFRRVCAEDGCIEFEDRTKIMIGDLKTLTSPELDVLDEFAFSVEMDEDNL